MSFDVRKNLMSLSCGFQRKLTPGLRYSQDVFEEFLFRYVPRSTAWLEVGCGHEILSDWRFDAERRLLDSARAVVGGTTTTTRSEIIDPYGTGAAPTCRSFLFLPNRSTWSPPTWWSSASPTP